MCRVLWGTLAPVATQAGKDVVLRMVEMFATGEVGAARETVAPDYRDHDSAAGAETLGVAGFCARVLAERSGYVELDVWPEGLRSDRDEVTAQLHWQGVLPTGDTLDRITIDVVRVQDGRAVEHWARPVSTRLIPAGEA
jgi:predicted SnoaL-like aldol condensation-catalyzing enzyme